MVQILQIQAELLQPKGSPFPHCGGLSRLEMSKRQRRQGLILVRKAGKLLHHIYQLPAHQLKGFRHHNDIGVISHIAGGSSQVDDSLCLGTLLSVSIYMGHHIVAHFLFPCLRHIIVDIILMSLQFVNLLLGNIQSQLLLGLR